jgi:hypothetical protein
MRGGLRCICPTQTNCLRTPNLLTKAGAGRRGGAAVCATAVFAVIADSTNIDVKYPSWHAYHRIHAPLMLERPWNVFSNPHDFDKVNRGSQLAFMAHHTSRLLGPPRIN